MKTDTYFYEFFRRYPEVLFKFAQLPYEGRWCFESVTIKSTEKRIDGFLARQDQTSPHFVITELQGYREEGFYWRFFREIATWFEQNPKEKRPYVALVVFLKRSHDVRNRRLNPKKPDRFIRVYLSEVLEALQDEPGPWMVLEPLALRSRKRLQARAPVWRERLKTLPRSEDELNVLRDMLTLSLLERFKNLSRKEIEAMFQLTPLEETRAGRELREEARNEGRTEGRTEGRNEGLLEGQRKLLTLVLQGRFGALPAAIQRQLELQDATRLEALAHRALSIQSLDELNLA
ncbi:MAG: DUF2887 domain-containing protein [Myxococcota bacterium]